MQFSNKHRKRKITKSANNYNKKCCPPISTYSKDVKTVPNTCHKFNSRRIK